MEKPTEFRIYELQGKDKEIIYNLMQLYTYELSFLKNIKEDGKLEHC